jgi:hypothetical protein
MLHLFTTSLTSLPHFTTSFHYLISLPHFTTSVLRLSEGSRGPKEGVNVDGIYAHLLSIAPGAGRVEVGQLETRRDKVLKGMQDGARRYGSIV